MTVEEQRRFPNRYAPFLQSIAIPTGGVFDAPFSSVNISKQWRGAIIGALNALAQNDVWDGDETETYNAQQQIEELIAAIGSEVNMYQYPIGAVFPFVSQSLPDGFELCDGTTYNQSQYPDAFAALPELHINGTQFQVPDLQNRFMRGAETTSFGDTDLGDTGGADSVTLQQDNLPVHPHGYFYPNAGQTGATGGSDFLAMTDVPSTLPTGDILDNQGDPVLASEPFSIVPHYVSINFIIFLGG